jgi:hypothetical protein
MKRLMILAASSRSRGQAPHMALVPIGTDRPAA